MHTIDSLYMDDDNRCNFTINTGAVAETITETSTGSDVGGYVFNGNSLGI